VKRVRFHPEARAEVRAAAEFYRTVSRGLAAGFVSEVRSAVDRVSRLPSSGAHLATGGVRRVVLGRFPFNLIYRDTDELMYVVAVMHQRRRPGYWRDRL